MAAVEVIYLLAAISWLGAVVAALWVGVRLAVRWRAKRRRISRILRLVRLPVSGLHGNLDQLLSTAVAAALDTPRADLVRRVRRTHGARRRGF
ncbi:hypothetical protein [Mycolicibacterium sp.]|uniref:hypothetical protein n=1 Tax=Mycolicibacterium sp. TaxID=2320850 RepID=UPI001A24E315|nr:hypothetical protein [Mycolicibacterium sp.]MBJ7337793.1 hypothetical protein [Mycolicibacterium sp.]